MPPRPPSNAYANLTRMKVYCFICEYKAANDGLSPTWGEIAKALYMARTTVRYHAFMLEKMKLIEIRYRANRLTGIKVTGATWSPPPPI
jgi:predicted transcriptional regulator